VGQRPAQAAVAAGGGAVMDTRLPPYEHHCGGALYLPTLPVGWRKAGPCGNISSGPGPNKMTAVRDRIHATSSGVRCACVTVHHLIRGSLRWQSRAGLTGPRPDMGLCDVCNSRKLASMAFAFLPSGHEDLRYCGRPVQLVQRAASCILCATVCGRAPNYQMTSGWCAVVQGMRPRDHRDRATQPHGLRREAHPAGSFPAGVRHDYWRWTVFKRWAPPTTEAAGARPVGARKSKSQLANVDRRRTPKGC